MPKKGGKKGAKKGKSKDDGPLAPEFGPLSVDGTIDPVKGGNIQATRLGRTYSLMVAPGAVDVSVAVSLRVTQYEGGTPANFQLEGRIVSNRVEILPANLELKLPATLTMPHFCADPDGNTSMFVAWEGQPVASNPPEEGETPAPMEPEPGEVVFKRLAGGNFSVGTGFANVLVSQLGVFYACSPHPDGIDYAVTDYKIPSAPRGTILNAVAFDWVQGELKLWSRASLDRPSAGSDGPVYIQRRSRLEVDLEPLWHDARAGSGDAEEQRAFEETFLVAGLKTNFLTGRAPAEALHQEEHKGAFGAVQFHVAVVPAHSGAALQDAQARLDRAVAELRMAEEEGLATQKTLDVEDRAPYLVRIEEARAALRDLEARYLPWHAAGAQNPPPPAAAAAPTESRISVAEPRPESPEVHVSAPAAPDGARGDEPPAGDAPAGNAPAEGAGAAEDGGAAEGAAGESAAPRGGDAAVAGAIPRQPYSELPQWTGVDMAIRFGARVVPSPEFQTTFLLSRLSLLQADKDGQPRRILEIPEVSDVPGGRARKVWVNPPRAKLFTFTPLSTRASYAELEVSVRLGDWTQRCTITLPNDAMTLRDVRRSVQSHCFGVDISEARFVKPGSSSGVLIGDEGSTLAATLRPLVGFVGGVRRPAEHRKKILLSYAPDVDKTVQVIAESLRRRNFPVVLTPSGAAAASFDDAMVVVVVLTKGYNGSATLRAEYEQSVARGLRRVHAFTNHFYAEGWLKQALKEQEFGWEAHSQFRQFTIPPNTPHLSSQQLDHLAIELGEMIPAPPAPVVFKDRQGAPSSLPPPVSCVEFARLNPIVINTATLAAELAAKKGGKKSK